MKQRKKWVVSWLKRSLVLTLSMTLGMTPVISSFAPAYAASQSEQDTSLKKEQPFSGENSVKRDATPSSAGRKDEESKKASPSSASKETKEQILYDEDGFLLDGKLVNDIDEDPNTEEEKKSETTIILDEVPAIKTELEDPLYDAAAGGTIGLNETVQGSLNGSVPSVQYELKPGASTEVCIEVDYNAYDNPVIELYRGSKLIRRCYDRSDCFSLNGGATYYVRLTAEDEDAYGDYSLTVELHSDLSDYTFIEGGKTKAQAKQIRLNGKYLSEIPLDEKSTYGEDWYKITPDISTEVILEVDYDSYDSSSGYKWELYKGNLLVQEWDTNTVLYLNGGTTYFIRVYSMDDSDICYGGYTFGIRNHESLPEAIYIDGGKSKDQAVRMQLGQEYLSMRPIGEKNAVDGYWYCFSSDQDIAAKISINNSYLTEPILELYRNNVYLGGEKNFSPYMDICMNKGDTFYIKLRARDVNDSDYYGTFKISVVVFEEFENSSFIIGGKNKEDAAALQIGKTYLSELPLEDRSSLATRWFKIVPNKSARIEVLYKRDSRVDLRIELWKDNTLIRDDINSTTWWSESFSYRLNGGSNYFLKVYTDEHIANGGEVIEGYGNYCFTLTEEEDLSDTVFVEGGKTRQTAKPIEVSKKYLSELPLAERDTTAEDWFVVSPGADTEVELLLELDRWLKDPDLILFEGNSVKGTRPGNYTLKKGSTYYIKIAAGGTDGDYYAGYFLQLKTPEVPVDNITLSPASLTLETGKTRKLSVTVSPADATNKKVTWKSSNTAVATVSSDGTVKAVKAGTATITVTALDDTYGTQSAECVLTVKNPTVNVTGVKLNTAAATIAVGKTQKLTATVSPTNATNKAVTWKTSNAAIATVASDGTVKAVKAGTATITVTTKDGGKTAACKVTVPVPVSSVKLNTSAVTLAAGKTQKLAATVLPANAANKAVTWKSSNTAVAAVASDGTVKAVKAGTATITVTTKDGNKTATCKVIVPVPVSSVKLNTSAVTLAAGKTQKLTATVLPANASNKAVTWKSSNTAVAAVASDGTVKAVKAGTATITVTTKDGSKTAKCTITVKNANGWVVENGKKYYYTSGTAAKGWKTISGNIYYFDTTTGAMVTGERIIDNIPCYFNPVTGIAYGGWRTVSGKNYWYEKGKRRGTKYDPAGVYYNGTNRGCEVVAPGPDGKLAWFWLDSVYNGAKAVSKEVMMPYTYNGKDTTPKWVRYDEKGAMIKGWYYDSKNSKWVYYNLTTGAMMKGGPYTIDGKERFFNEATGALIGPK